VSLSIQFIEVQIRISEVAALAAATEMWFDNGDWRGADPLLVERTAHLIGAIARAANASTAKADRFEAALADAQPPSAASSVDAWDFADPPVDPAGPATRSDA
jgi:hypothetical protein